MSRSARRLHCTSISAAILLFTAAGLWTPPTPAESTPRIVSPTAKETIHNDGGNLPVSVELTETDRLPPGYALQACIDDKPLAAPQRTLHFVLSGIDRGTHSLSVRLLDARGETVTEAAPVTFYMWRASRLFPLRRDKPQ